MPHIEIKQFDQIKLRTTRSIRYLSAPNGVMPEPNGVWTVIGSVGGELLVSKGDVTCKVPVKDVYLMGGSLADHLMETINGQKDREDGKSGKRIQKPR